MAKVTGGDKIEAALKEIAARIGDGTAVRIGFLKGSTYPDGASVPMVAAIQEFGAPVRKIPPRPFFRSMVAEKSPAWPKAIADLLVANKYDGRKTMAQVGEAIAGQLRESITTFSTPANAPSTIARKGFDKPLVETGHLLASVSYEVKD
jgi:hypothetical protein